MHIVFFRCICQRRWRSSLNRTALRFIQLLWIVPETPRRSSAATGMYILHFRSIFLHFVQTNNLAGGVHIQALPYYSIHGNYRKGIGSGCCSALIFNDLLQLGPLISITGIITPAEAKSNNTTRCSAQAACFIMPLQNELCFISIFFFLCNLIYGSGALKDRATRLPQTRSDNIKQEALKLKRNSWAILNPINKANLS